MNKIKKKIKNLIKNLDFKYEECNEIIKLYKCLPFDKTDINYKKLLSKSKQLCEEYTKIYLKLLANDFNGFCEKIRAVKRKKKILKILFPVKAPLLSIRNNIDVVCGLVEPKWHTFINAFGTFPKDGIVILGKNATLAPYVTFLGGTHTPYKTILKNNCWLGAGVVIKPGVTIYQNSVVGAGAFVWKDVPKDKLYIGRENPIISNIYIYRKSKSSNKYLKWNGSDEESIEYIKTNYPYSLKGFKKAIKCQNINLFDLGLIKLYNHTKSLVAKYELGINKNESLNELVPNHGKNLKIGKNFYVDLPGTTYIGDNVKIGDNVMLAGKVYIGNNVKIGNNCILYASSHPLLKEERLVAFNFKEGLHLAAFLGTINIANNIIIGDNSNIVLNSNVNCDVPPNSLYVNNKLVK